MLCGWEGNRRSDVTLAVRHRLSGISTYGLNGLGKGDEYYGSEFRVLWHLYSQSLNPCCTAVACDLETPKPPISRLSPGYSLYQI